MSDPLSIRAGALLCDPPILTGWLFFFAGAPAIFIFEGFVRSGIFTVTDSLPTVKFSIRYIECGGWTSFFDETCIGFAMDIAGLEVFAEGLICLAGFEGFTSCLDLPGKSPAWSESPFLLRELLMSDTPAELREAGTAMESSNATAIRLSENERAAPKFWGVKRPLRGVFGRSN